MNSLRGYYFFVFAMYAVVVPHYQLFLSALGYSPRNVGILIGFFEIFGVVGPILLGRIADKTGRFRELKVGSTLGAGVFLSLLLGNHSLAVAILLSGAAGFLMKSSVPLTDAVAGTILSDPREQYGQVRVFGSFGFAAASLLVPGLSLVDASQPSSMMIAFLVSIAIFAAVVLIIPPPKDMNSPGDTVATEPAATDTDESPDAAAIKESAVGVAEPTATADTEVAPEAATSRGDAPVSPRLPATFWWMVAAIGIGNVAFGAYNSFFSLYLREALAIENVTVYWAVGAVSEVPIIFYSGRLIRRFGTGPLLVVAGATMTARLLLYALEPTAPVVVVIQLMHALSFGLMLSAGIAHVNRVVPLARRGTATTAFNALGIGLAVFTGAVLGGHLVEIAGFTGMFALIAVFPAASAVIFTLRRRVDDAFAPW